MTKLSFINFVSVIIFVGATIRVIDIRFAAFFEGIAISSAIIFACYAVLLSPVIPRLMP